MSDRRFRVGVVWSPQAWPLGLHAYASEHVADVDVVVVRDERAALESDSDILIIDECTPWLTPAFLSVAAASNVIVVGVWTTTEPSGERRLVDLNVQHRIEASMPAGDVMYLVSRLRPADLRTTFDRLVADLTVPDPAGVGGATIAVGGPPGAGAREVAIGLANILGRSHPTALIDVNETSPGVARRLGLDLYPHVLSALGAMDRGDPDPLDANIAHSDRHVVPLAFDVVAGLPSGKDWDRLLPRDAERLVAACEQRWSRVVLSTSPMIDDLRRWVDRYGVSRQTLAWADVVVGVCEATPRGILRFGDWLAELIQLRADRIIVVTNKVPRARNTGSQANAVLRSLCGDRLDAIVTAPFDKTVTRGEWEATVPRRGPFVTAMGELAEHVQARCGSLADRMEVVA